MIPRRQLTLITVRNQYRAFAFKAERRFLMTSSCILSPAGQLKLVALNTVMERLWYWRLRIGSETQGKCLLFLIKEPKV